MFKVFRKKDKDQGTGNLKLVAVVAAVLVLPLAYSFLYLWAFWDPYSQMADLPIAVVNLDQGAIIDDVSKNVGQEVVDKLKSNTSVKWVFTNENDMEEGLSNRRYYGAVVFPSQFSQQIATVESEDKVKGLFIYKVNEKRNFLAGQVMNRVAIELKDTITESVSKEIVGALTDEMRRLPDDLQTLENGLGEIQDGTQVLYDKMGDLVAGQRKFNSGVRQLSVGIVGAQEGASQLSSGTKAALAGSEKVTDGLGQLQGGVEKLGLGSKQVSNGVAVFAQQLEGYTGGVNQLLDSLSSAKQAQAKLGTSLMAYVKAHPEAMADPNMAQVVKSLQAPEVEKANQAAMAAEQKLREASMALVPAIKQLGGGASEVAKGLEAMTLPTSQLLAGSKSLNDGLVRLSKGSEDLAQGLLQAKEGVHSLSSYSTALLSGQKKIEEGVATLNEGVDTAHTGVTTAVIEAQDKIAKADGVDQFVSQPVVMEDQKVNPIPDYGTAFTPYFVSLSLWVGALMMFFGIYLDQGVKNRRAAKPIHPAVRFIIYSAIGLGQALIVSFVLLNVLHLEVQNIGLFYLACGAISLTFVSIMRFLLVHVGDVGKFVGVLLLILQLTACGGTFPMELVPGFFQVINPYMPMTYTVNVLKEVISGIDMSYLRYNMFILLSIGGVFTLLNIGLGTLKSKGNEVKVI